MLQDSENSDKCLASLRVNLLRHHSLAFAACAWFVYAWIGIDRAYALDSLRSWFIASPIQQTGPVWAAETAAPSQENKKGIDKSNPRNDSGTPCVRRMDICYEDCKPGEAQPGLCNLSCTTDKICGMPLRMSYGQFLDFQVEMLAAKAKNFPEAAQHPQNAKTSPAQPQALPDPRRRAPPHRMPAAQAKPAAGRSGAGSAETGAAENSAWPRLSWPQLSWPRF
jgi:hypothetical protein